MLVAQALVEGVALLTFDARVADYSGQSASSERDATHSTRRRPGARGDVAGDRGGQADGGTGALIHPDLQGRRPACQGAA
jgi:hypothetical protein